MTGNQNGGHMPPPPQQSNVTIKVPEYKELIDHALAWGYGDFKSHAELGIIMGLTPTTNRYYDQVGRANRKLIEYGKVLVPVRGKGYEVLNPDEYPDLITRNVDQGRKKIAKALKIADNAPESMMSPSGLQRHRAVKDRVSAFYLIAERNMEKVVKASEMKIQLTPGRVKGPAATP